MKPVKLSPLMLFYLVCAIAGFFVPWYYNIQHLLTSDVPFTPANMFAAGMVSPMSSSLTTDFLISSTPILIWMVVEGKRLKMKYVWAYVLFTFLIAFAFTCPLFLFNRERLLKNNATA
jgi:heme/copper-type cytochrome/quinol oxidase subunit 3